MGARKPSMIFKGMSCPKPPPKVVYGAPPPKCSHYKRPGQGDLCKDCADKL